MAENIEPVASFKRGGFKCDVYANRVEIGRIAMFGRWNTTTVLMRNIASVDVAAMTKNIVIKTTDGKKYELLVGGFGDGADRIRNAIMAHL